MRLITTLATLALASPVLADEVNVYSYRQPELIAPLTEAFTAETGIDVNVAFLEKGMVEKLTAEGNRTPADVILTVDIARLNSVIEAGLTQPVESEILTANIPANLRGENNEWFGLTTRARVIYASKERVADGEVTTYEDLADPKWKGRICTRSGTHAYNTALIAAMLSHHDEAYVTTWLEGVKANLARKPQGNDRAQIKAIWAAECDIAIGNTYYMGQMLADEEQKAWADSVDIVFPTFEGSGTHVNISGVAMTKYAPNRDNAVKFMEFLASSKAQEIYAAKNFEYPIAPGTSVDPVVASWGEFTADETNLMEIAQLRAQAIRLAETVDFDG
ncbi:Fe(3+) ABC transporter substrate-binding protein [Falsihalocynthiibacter sp. S25ZX9]|uniref:Fe(3+) ABC transporter substrate-binding protein n=1 Tax=unclassified Falsihalocynthiibacter TaxID=2854191 RepID=UPI00350EFF47